MPHDPRLGPDPDALHPLPNHPRVTFLRNLDLPPNVEVGADTDDDDPAGPQAVLDNILYHFAFLGDRLRIGRSCALATGTRFHMNGGNHRIDAPATDPFAIFGGAWAGRFPEETAFPNRRDTVIGHDVWFGHDSTILPGLSIGTGAVVAAKSVVTRNVPPYAIAAGNPAVVVRMRVPPEVAERLLALAWWDWTPERITRCLPSISGGDVAALDGLAADSAIGLRHAVGMATPDE